MGKHYEQLTTKERVAITLMKSDKRSAREIATALRRAPSTRELKHFAFRT